MSANIDEFDVVIIDTGCANLSSVRFAFERLGAKVLVTDDKASIKAAKRVVLPGVGSAGAAMASLSEKALVELIQGLTQPVLGVCLGMQMLTLLSKERGGQALDCQTLDCKCLGIIPTEIDELDRQILKVEDLPLPHMGWNQLTFSNPSQVHPLFAGVPSGSYVYFVHSYRAPLSDYTLAQCRYGEDFSAAIGKDNFMGVQFHPEKSAAVGAQILGNFLKMQ
ncbi:imidazole glycerol phosphate synthase subunit HisH [Shewanella xiamenensis]|uniref:imidazole glycerol phosphate synthase subunit HisH n=1 Tax=Shewanella xiamenensis TaxID=332186 RepID=UPI001C4E4937|nr:imidazole glycerol phosphate synthase subunit HisH [Shewanella xiamenensis]MBW0281468.1 imidazole glycerol phosphate synthase subunit HisH [Shewanella xiamenensis]MCT8872159.1 imidazole glycerol phosphate synthase subunit HisH [Shewanella xiamenensis]UWH40066.1 imidazole glycerol phosphate synthase subunit HisH [Shewanella xiamenensis]